MSSPSSHTLSPHLILRGRKIQNILSILFLVFVGQKFSSSQGFPFISRIFTKPLPHARL